MGILGSIVSDVTSLAKDPGKLVADAANAVLPSNMKAVGDILGGITDIESGNPLAALSHLQDALKDLPQLMQALGGAANGATNAAKPAGTAGAEPSPPQARSTSAGTLATTSSAIPPSATSTSTPAPATTASTIPAPLAPARSTTTATPKAPPTVTVSQGRGQTITTVDDGTNTTRVFHDSSGHNVVRVSSDATGKVVADYAGYSSNISVGGEHVSIDTQRRALTTSIDNGINTAIVNQNGAATNISVGQDRAPPVNPWLSLALGLGKPGTAAPTTATAGATAPTASAGSAPAASGGTTAAAAATGTTAPSASGSSTGTTGASSSSATGPSSASSAAPADLASLMALSPDQFMQAVTSGKIPPDVANDQSAMMQVQARMNQITQMNQLVTSMMAAAHQMQLSIIKNIRC